jgi:hypothetical protein
MKHFDSLLKATLGIALCALPLGATGCLPSLNDPDYGPLNSQFPVSDIFSPSGFMGDGAKPGYLTVDFEESHCKQPRPAGHQGRCYTFTYYMDPTAKLMWAGAYWVFPTNSWGVRPGYAFDATKFQQVRFYAAVETPAPGTMNTGGNIFLNSIAGGIKGGGFYGPPCPTINHYTTDAKFNEMGQLDPNGTITKNVACEHDDGFRAEEDFTIGKDVGPDYKQFHIPVANAIANATDPMTGAPKIPDELIGAFAWSMAFPNDSCICSIHVDSNAECVDTGGVLTCPQPVKIYLDDIVWDTAPPPTP